MPVKNSERDNIIHCQRIVKCIINYNVFVCRWLFNFYFQVNYKSYITVTDLDSLWNIIFWFNMACNYGSMLPQYNLWYYNISKYTNDYILLVDILENCIVNNDKDIFNILSKLY